MARRPSSERRRFEALLDKHIEEIRKAYMLAIEDITGSITLIRLQNAIENLRTVVAASVGRAVTEADWAAERARIRIALAIETAAMNAVLTAANIEYGFYRPLEEAIRRAFVEGAVGAIDGLPTLRAGDGAKVVFRFDVRNPTAEAWLNTHSSDLVTRLVEEQREVVRSTLAEGMMRGQNPRATALDIVGRVDRVTGKRTGGVIGLTGPQEETMAWVRRAFAQNDTEAMKRYLRLKTRDRRYDRIIREAIRTGKISAADADKIAGRLSDRYLKLRADTIARTESLASLNAGRTETFRQAAAKAGVDQQFITRVWSATMDGRTRDTHGAMNGQVVAGTEMPFRTPGGALMMFPGDSSLGAPASEVVNCRCMAQMRTDFFEGRA